MAKNNFIVNNDFSNFIKVFLEENSKLNLISKNDGKVLYEKHIYDSLSVKLLNIIKDNSKILDIGCGGGFPCLPISIEFPNANVAGIDSIRKKINAVNNIKSKLGIKNLSAICGRVENQNFDEKFDIITSRAVANLGLISQYALPLLDKNGYFVAYKSKKAIDEIYASKSVLSKFNAKVIDVVEYELPLEEVYERCLVVIGF